MKITNGCLLGLLALFVVIARFPAAHAAEDGEMAGEARENGASAGGNKQTIDSADPAYAEADAVLNAARAATDSAATARTRVDELRRMLEAQPEYPNRAMAQYLIGVNCRILERYAEAAAAFTAALAADPGLAERTAINSYLTTSRQRLFGARASKVFVTILAVILAPALWRLLRVAPGTVRWGPPAAVFGAALAVWAAAVFLLPLCFGTPETGLKGFPKPVLVNTRVGQLGDETLRALAGYGAGTILAALPVIVAVGTLQRRADRRFCGTLGVLIVTCALMGTYYVRYCHGRGRYDAAGKRLVFMVKDVATKKDVPDEMLPLYDENFRKRILDSRKQVAP